MRKADRIREYEDDHETISQKCIELAELLKSSKCTLVYTGAGISTAASIPDYRGPNGVWTLAEKGIALSRCGDPVESAPTTSHMVLKEMCRNGIVQHILSQNCDGLHLRSGVPQKMLSEIHGNMHIEVCNHCNPPRQFVRPFDVTQNSQYRRHGTGRTCTACHTELADTIVHFGEVGRVPWPLNWSGVVKLIDQCELIVCIGTSLTVLKQYEFLWPKPKSTTQIAIVNLQWTPKDRICRLKINAKCDTVLEKLAKLLSISANCYCRDCDPVLNPRRSTRVCELMERLTDCTCHLRVPRAVCHEAGPKGTPGWWAAGIQRVLKRSHKVVASNQNKRPAGRPRKSKSSVAVRRRSQGRTADISGTRVDDVSRSFVESPLTDLDVFAEQSTSTEDSDCCDDSSIASDCQSVAKAAVLSEYLDSPSSSCAVAAETVNELDSFDNEGSSSLATITSTRFAFQEQLTGSVDGPSEPLNLSAWSNIVQHSNVEEFAVAATVSDMVAVVSQDTCSCFYRHQCS